MNKLNVIDNFIKISKIYRESCCEDKIADFFMDVARCNNLYCYKDNNNNVYIRKNGREDREPVLIQARLDMVCVSSNNYDFSKGIDVIIDDSEIRVNGTSLGADQGIGLAYMLTLICDKKN